MTRLIDLWNPAFRFPADANVCRALRSTGLECYKDRGKWADLVSLNRPAIITLQTSDGGEHHVLLRKLDDSYATLDSALGPQRYKLEDLDKLWNGEFLILWRPEIAAGVIGPESRGDAVLWLRRRLAQLEGKPIPSPLFGFYDKDLRAQVLKFQSEHGLEHAGVVRTRTLIALTANQAGSPTLQDNTP